MSRGGDLVHLVDLVRLVLVLRTVSFLEQNKPDKLYKPNNLPVSRRSYLVVRRNRSYKLARDALVAPTLCPE
jgi:hypothetical protein